jgi:hypothetical protein
LPEAVRLLDLRDRLTPADHQTHRRYQFDVPSSSHRLDILVRYAPKRVDEAESRALAQAALHTQAAVLRNRVGARLADAWAASLTQRAESVRISNLLTISLDDPAGAYRGAGHRQSNNQQMWLANADASPGLVPGPLPAGTWMLTLSVHTLVSPQCEVWIQIGAEMASSRP